MSRYEKLIRRRDFQIMLAIFTIGFVVLLFSRC